MKAVELSEGIDIFRLFLEGVWSIGAQCLVLAGLSNKTFRGNVVLIKCFY